MTYCFSLGRCAAGLLGLLAAAPLAAQAQAGGVRIGTAGVPDASAVLDLSSSTKGLLLPRLTLAQRTALTANAATPPVPGLVIYQTDNTPGLYAYDGTAWVRLGADNLGNHTATQNLDLGANHLVGNGGSTGLSVGSTGNVGVGVASPTAALDVNGGIVAPTNGLIGTQGAHLQWNRTGGMGETWLLNQQGLGPGGIRFGASDAVGSGTNTVTEWARFDGSGNLGLGTPTPTQLLDVNGSAAIAGNAYVNGGQGVVLNQQDRPLITRGWDAFTAGAYQGAGRWGVFMEPSTLTFGVPALAGKNFQWVRYNDNSTVAGTLLTLTQEGNLGVGTPNPAASLDVNGALVLEETASSSLTGANPAYVIPANVSTVRLVPGTTPPIGTIALSSTTPVVGQHLAVYNGTTIGATLGGQPIGAGQASLLVYSSGAWRGTSAAGDNLGNHTATQNLNLNTYDLVGGTTARAQRGGLSLDGNGLLTLGAPRVSPDSTTRYGVRLFDLDQDFILTSKRFKGKTNPLSISGPGDRLTWLAYYSAFRAGGVTGSRWDYPNVGSYSVAFGLDNQAGSDFTVAFGQNNRLRASDGTLATGYGNEAVQGYYGVMMGRENTYRGYHGLVGGYQSKVQTSTSQFVPSLAFGYSAQARTSQGSCYALGYYARTGGYYGCFVLADYSPSQNPDTNRQQDSLVSTNYNQFSARFAGGYRLFTTAATAVNQGTAVGVSLTAGGNAWQTISDSTKKERRVLADGNAFLARIGALRLGSWNYIGQSPDTMRHYGPMAQDFYAAFGHDGVGRIGEPTSINQADFDGVNLIAIQALYRRIQVLEADNARQRVQLHALAAPAPAPAAPAGAATAEALAALEARLRRLEAVGEGQARH